MDSENFANLPAAVKVRVTVSPFCVSIQGSSSISGKLYYFFGNRNRNRRLNLGTLLSRGRHRFSPLSTEDKDPELDLLNSDPEIEEYSIMENKTA